MKLNLTLYPLLIVVSLVYFTGCSIFRGPVPVSTPSAIKAISSVESKNNGLRTFKGIGTFNIRNEDRVDRFRFAWAGSRPDKLKGIALISGKPVETIASDGEYIYLKSHTDSHRFIRKKADSITLERLISAPVTPSDIIAILSGNLPLPEYTSCRVEPLSGNSLLISIFEDYDLIQKIFIDSDEEPYRIERFDGSSKMFTLTFSDYRQTDGYRLPFAASILTDESECNIKFIRHIINPDIPPDTFTLSSD